MGDDFRADLYSLCRALRPALSLPPLSIDRPEPVTKAIAKFAHDRHRVGPLLSIACKCDTGTGVAGDAEPILARSYQNNTYWYLRRKAAQQKLITLFQANAIDFTFIKGDGLAKQIHDDPVARMSNDIDILVSPDRAAHAAAMLNAEGYAYRPNTLRRKQAFAVARQKMDMYIHKDLTFVDRQSRIQIELHQRLFKFEPNGLTADFIGSLDEDIDPSLSNGFYCLYLILHGAITSWRRLKWVIDLTLIVRAIPSHTRLEMMHLAQKYGCEKAVAASLFMAEDLFPDSLDEEWRSLLKRYEGDKAVCELQQLFYERLTDDPNPSITLPLRSLILSGSSRLIFRNKISVIHSLFLRTAASLSLRV